MQLIQTITTIFTFGYFLLLGTTLRMHAFTESKLGQWIDRSFRLCRHLIVPAIALYATYYIVNGVGLSTVFIGCFIGLMIINEISMTSDEKSPLNVSSRKEIMSVRTHNILFMALVALLVGFGLIFVSAQV